jgi:hypothetical protein
MSEIKNDLREERAKIRDDFMRRLFAVAISVGFASAFSNMGWVKQARYPDNSETNQLLVLFIAFYATIQSWDGYLLSIQTKKLYGEYRFAIDILLVLIYMFLLINSMHYYILAPVLAIIFALYVVWDFLTIREHYSKFDLKSSIQTAPLSEAIGIYLKGARDYADIYRGPIITFCWFLYFVIFYVIVALNDPKTVAFVCCFEFIGLFLYRKDKAYENDGVKGFRMVTRVALLLGLILIAWHMSYYFQV